MTSPAITVPESATPAQIADTLTRHRISGAPVVDDAGTVLGLVSEYDLLATGAAASDMMSTALISVSPECPDEDMRHPLVDRRIRRVPVLDKGRLVGIVSRGDVIAIMATEWVCQVYGEPVSAWRRSTRSSTTPRRCTPCSAGRSRYRW